MANFTPVGVEATVKNLGDFTSDLGKMGGAAEKTSQKIGDSFSQAADVFVDANGRLRNSQGRFIKSSDDSADSVQRSGKAFKKAGKDAKGFDFNLGNIVNTISNVTSAVIDVTRFVIDLGRAAFDAAVGLGKMAFGLGKEAFDAAVSFESAFAGVIKTTDGLVDSYGNLTEIGAQVQQDFRDLAKTVPIAVEELLEIGEAGGQLGVAQEDLIAFTETIAAMGVATNLTQEEAATQFAQIANVMGTTERIGADAFGRLGSTIVALGNNFATTEADISNFASRIAGAGAIAGLTESDVFAIGAAFSSVGVAAEAGGTAVQKVLLGMNTAVISGGDQLEVFAGVAGESADEFAELWEADASQAFQQFVEGLGVAGDDAIFVLEELGLTDQRLTRAFLSLANSGDLLNNTLDLATEAWDDNNALQNEAAQRYATTESQMLLFKNQMKDIGITIGSFVLPIFNDLLSFAQPLIDAFSTFATEVLGGIQTPLEGLSNLFIDIESVLGNFLTEDQMAGAQGFIDFIQGPVLDTLFNLESWLQENIPIAIQTVSDFWTNTLIPALTGAWTFIETNILPVLATVQEWLAEIIPIAIDIISTKWNDVLLPALAALQEEWVNNIQPALAEFWGWLQERLPGAIATLTDIWENTLKPALQTVGTFISDTLIPILSDITVWLLENIPKAVDATVDNWENILLPAFNTVWSFIDESILPIFNKVFEWLQTKIPQAIETARQFWEDVLKPAIEVVWNFIDQNLIPLFNVLVELIQVTLAKALEIFAALWDNRILPALKEVWEFIKENVLPILNDMWEFIKDKLGPTIQWLKESVIDALAQSFEFIAEKIKQLIDNIAKLRDKIANMKIPDWAKGKSPPPLANWFSDIASAVDEVASVELPKMAASLEMVTPIAQNFQGAMASPSMTAQPVMNTNVNNTFNTNVNGGMGQAAFEARVLKIVNQAIGTGT